MHQDPALCLGADAREGGMNGCFPRGGDPVAPALAGGAEVRADLAGIPQPHHAVLLGQRTFLRDVGRRAAGKLEANPAGQSKATVPADQAECTASSRRCAGTSEEDLTERQRQVFVAIVLNDVAPRRPGAKLNSARNAIYKTMFDARRKLRAALAANGYPATSGGAAGDVPANADTGRRS